MNPTITSLVRTARWKYIAFVSMFLIAQCWWCLSVFQALQSKTHFVNGEAVIQTISGHTIAWLILALSPVCYLFLKELLHPDTGLKEWRTIDESNPNEVQLRQLFLRLIAKIPGLKTVRLYIVRAQHVNAYAGMNWKERYVLFTAPHLDQNLPANEQESILGHELGHLILNSTPKVLLARVLFSLPLAFCLAGATLSVYTMAVEDLMAWFFVAGLNCFLSACAMRMIQRIEEYSCDRISVAMLNHDGMANYLHRASERGLNRTSDRKLFLSQVQYNLWGPSRGKSGFEARCENIFDAVFRSHPRNGHRINRIRQALQTR